MERADVGIRRVHVHGVVESEGQMAVAAVQPAAERPRGQHRASVRSERRT